MSHERRLLGNGLLGPRLSQCHRLGRVEWPSWGEPKMLSARTRKDDEGRGKKKEAGLVTPSRCNAHTAVDKPGGTRICSLHHRQGLSVITTCRAGPWLQQILV